MSQHGQGERKRLAATSWRQGDEVVALHGQRQGLRLYGGRLLEALYSQRAEDFVRELRLHETTEWGDSGGAVGFALDKHAEFSTAGG